MSPSSVHSLQYGTKTINYNLVRSKRVKTSKPYIGKAFPTFFRLKDGIKKLNIDCPVNSSCTVKFETGADNDYFKRSRNAGKFNAKPLYMIKSYTLWNGIGKMKITPDPNREVGDVVSIVTEVKDKTRSTDPFVSRIDVTIVEPVIREVKESKEPTEDDVTEDPPPPGGRIKKETDEGSDGKKGILIPQVTWVSKGDTNWDRFNFNEQTGLKILPFQNNLDIYLNKDNLYLQNEIMYRKSDPEILREQFKIGLVLGCLGIYHHYKSKQESNTEQDIFEQINEISIGLAQVILSIISVSKLSKLEEIQIPN